MVPNMERGALNSDYLRKCVNASIIAIESYDQNGNNGLSYDEIKDVSIVKKLLQIANSHCNAKSFIKRKDGVSFLSHFLPTPFCENQSWGS